MFVSGRVWKYENMWLIEAPVISIMTQGYSKKDAYHMLIDAVELYIDSDEVKVDIANIKE